VRTRWWWWWSGGIRTGRRAAVLCVECVYQCVSPGAELGPACLLLEPGWTFFPRLLVVPQRMLAGLDRQHCLSVCFGLLRGDECDSRSFASRVEDARHLYSTVVRVLKGFMSRGPFRRSHRQLCFDAQAARELASLSRAATRPCRPTPRTGVAGAWN
jgi:hypothetical protein